MMMDKGRAATGASRCAWAVSSLFRSDSCPGQLMKRDCIVYCIGTKLLDNRVSLA